MAQFSLKDWTVNVIPGIAVGNNIVPAGAPVAVASFTSIDFDPGGQADYVAGPNVHPLAIAIMMAKGKCDIEISQASDGWSVRSALGGVGGMCIVSLVAARAGMVPVSFALFGNLKNGGGFKAGDKGTDSKMEFLFQKALQDGAPIYNELA
jgi:hypothetical protein